MRLGDPIRVVKTKWGDRPHWEYDATWLGRDEHGTWFGAPAGTVIRRPDLALTSTVDQVGLVPSAAHGGGGGWVASFHAPGYDVSTYVDMTTVPVWDGSIVRAVDLDLDVIRTSAGEVFVDDADEFAAHRMAYGYPPDVVSLAERSCAWVLESVLAGGPPFGSSISEVWLDELRRL